MKLSGFCTVLFGAVTTFALTPKVSAAPDVWNDTNQSWSNTANWTPAVVPGVNANVGDDVTIGTLTSSSLTNPIVLDTGTVLGIPTVVIGNLTFNDATGVDISNALGEVLTISGTTGVTNTVAAEQKFDVQVVMGANSTLTGGPGAGFLDFNGILAIGTQHIATSGTVKIEGDLDFTINSTAAGLANTTYGTIAPVTMFGGSISINSSSTYLAQATAAADQGDVFKLSTGSFTGQSAVTLPAFTGDTSIQFVSTLIDKGILFVEPIAGGTVYINAGTPLPIDTDSEFAPSGTTITNITLNGGELVTNNLGDSGSGTAYSTTKTVAVNSTGGTIAATAGTTATYNGVISNGNGAGVLTVGDSTNTGTVVFSAANSHSGGTTVAGGLLKLTGAGKLGSSGGSVTVQGGSTLDINGINQTVGTLTFGTGGSTVTSSASTGTITASAVSVTGTSNTLASSVILNGTAAIAAGGALADNGSITAATVGSGTLTGSGTVTGATTVSSGTITGSGLVLGGGTSYSGAGFLGGTVTSNVTVGSAGVVTQNAGTLTGNIVLNGSYYVGSGATVSGTATINNGGTLGGVGHTSDVGLASGGAINLVDSTIGTLTVGSLTTTGGSMTFEIGGSTVSTDKVAAGVIAINSGTTISIVNLTGSGAPTLTAGQQYTLISGSSLSGFSNLTLSTSTLDNMNLSLAQSGNNIVLDVTAGSGGGGGGSATNGQYTLTSTLGSSPNVHVNGGTATINTVIQNTGSGTQDTLNYSGLTVTPDSGTVGAGSHTSGTALAQGASGTTSTQTYTSGATIGTVNINPTATVTNTTATGTPQSTIIGTSVAVYSGQSVWIGDGTSSPSWGTLTAGFGQRWALNGGSPGLDPNFTDTDTATFGDITPAQATQTIFLNGASPSLKAITFDATGTIHYLIEDGSGGTLTLNGGSAHSTITDSASGTQTLATTTTLTTTSDLNVSTGSNLDLDGTFSGAGGFVTTGTGTVIIAGTENNTGDFDVNTGTLFVNPNGITSASTTINVGTAGTLIGSGTMNGNATVTGNGIINLSTGATIGGNLTATGGNWNGVGTVTGMVASNSGTFTVANAANLTTTSVTVNGGKMIDAGTITAPVTIAGGTFGGTGSVTGAVALNSGSINLTDSTIGVLTVGGLTTTGGGLTFEIGGTATGTDSISSGSLSIGSGTTVSIVNLGGTAQTLAIGDYTLLSGSSLSGFGNLTLSTTSLDNRTLSLVQNGNVVELDVAASSGGGGGSSATNGQYTGAVTVTGATRVHINGTTTVQTTVQNTGSGTQDTLDYSGLGAAASAGSLGASSAPSGTALAQGSTATTTQTYTAGTTGGSVTLSQAGTVANSTATGTPTRTATGATISVYTGQGVWIGNGTATGSYGTLATGFGTNFGANQGSPGLDSNFLSTDTATFGNINGQSLQTVTLDGASPSLNTLTFSGTTTSYTLAQGTGGTVKLNGGSGAATIAVSGGSHTISAPVELDTNVNVATASGTLTMNTISEALGSHSLTKSGSGFLLLDGADTYTGGTTLTAGTLVDGNANALGDLNISGGTLAVGNGLHTITVNGNYVQTGGTLLLNLTGVTPNASPGYELLHVTGNATLGGTLQVVVNSPYVPTVGDTFTFVTAANITGGFSTLTTNLPTLSLTAHGTGTVTLTVAQLPFATVAGAGYTPNEQAIAANIDQNYQAGATVPIQQLIAALNLTSADPGALSSAIQQLSPQKTAELIRTVGINTASFNTQIDDEFFLRQITWDGFMLGGNGQIDSSGLSLVDPSMDPGLAQVRSQLLAWSPAPISHGLLSDTPDPVLGGVALRTDRAAAPADSGNNFNVFVLGNVVLSQDFSQDNVPHSDATSAGVQIGGSYRITPHLRAGVTFGYGHADAKLDPENSRTTIDSYTPGVFVNYAQGGWFANAIASYGFNDNTQDRHIVLPGLDGTAHSEPGGDQITADLDGGYQFHTGAFTYGPTAGVQYTHLDVDSYTETGFDPGDLHVDKQQVDSLRGRLGGQVQYALRTSGVILTPHLDASWQHEFLDQGRGLNSQFANGTTGGFAITTAHASRDSALIDLGANAELHGDITLYLDYLVQAGQDNYFGQAVQAGVKLGF